MINSNFLDYKHLHIKILLCFLVFICFFLSLNTIPPLDRDESRYIQATVQMLESKDFVNIKFLDAPRLKKPPGIYWLQALSATITKNILYLDQAPLWSYRLPSAIAASISILLTFLLGKILFGRTQGIIAALLLVSSPLVFIEAHIAKTDSVLLACILFITYVLSKVIFEKKYEISHSKYLIFLAWITMGFAFLIKGPLVIMFILFTVIFFRIFSKQNFIKDLQITIGLMLFIMVALPWFIIINVGDNSSVFLDSVKKDMFLKLISAQESHGAPPGTYLLSSIVSAWPIFLFIIPTSIWAYKKRKEKAVIFLLCSILPAWIVFELVPTKLMHYILPLLPSLAILSAAMIVSLNKMNTLNILNKFFIRIISLLPSLGGIIISSAIWVLAIKFGKGITLSVFLVIFIYFISSIICAYFLFKRNYLTSFITIVFSNLLALNILFIFLPKQLDKIWVTEKVYEYIKKENIQHSVGMLGYSEPSLVFRLGSSSKILTSSDDAIDKIIKNKIKYIIIEDKYTEEFIIKADENQLSINVLNIKVSGFNYSKGEYVIINIINVL